MRIDRHGSRVPLLGGLVRGSLLVRFRMFLPPIGVGEDRVRLRARVVTASRLFLGQHLGGAPFGPVVSHGDRLPGADQA
jgi:hypothetical protein